MKRRASEEPWPVSVLLSCPDHTLADLVARNLDRRAYTVHQVAGTVRGGVSVPIGVAFDLVISDTGDEDVAAWDHVVWLRATFPYLPLVILAHGWPGASRIAQLQPCELVRKPFAIDELLAACATALSVSSA